MISLPASFGVVVVLSQNLELVSVKREIKDGMYAPAAYMLIITLIQLPWMVILSIFALVPGGYLIEGFAFCEFGARHQWSAVSHQPPAVSRQPSAISQKGNIPAKSP